jgi:hypothetical protein
MLIAKMVLLQARKDLHWHQASTCAHTCTKLYRAETISKATAAILVKFMSIFWGDPRSGKKIEINTSQIDRRTRFSPLEGQMIGAYKS